jgi:hypothetical protein
MQPEASLAFKSKTSTFLLGADTEPLIEFFDKPLHLSCNRESRAFEFCTKKSKRDLCELSIKSPKNSSVVFIEIPALAVAILNVKSGQFFNIYPAFDGFIISPYTQSGKLKGSFKIRESTSPDALRRYAAEDRKEEKVTLDALKAAGTRARATIARMLV